MSDVYEKYAALRSQQSIANDTGKVEKIHAKGKLTAQERLQCLFDDGRYEETDPWVRNRCVQFDLYKKNVGNEGAITAFGKVNGRKVCSFAHDATIYGGSGGEAQFIKVIRLLELAINCGAPIVSMNDASGSRVQEGVAGLNAYCTQFYKTTAASGWVPHISLVMGATAGGSAYACALTDFIIMVRPIGKLFITGPAVIKAVTGEVATFDDLGSSDVHSVTT
ncbi:MAG: methylmalonyl-CoA carboxyltransferase, partial [Lachnospiraceae bacterium]|nr:methylmalonyl-CoA carboxyltransferase [Lachnospiraceae bacterium]